MDLPKWKKNARHFWKNNSLPQSLIHIKLYFTKLEIVQLLCYKNVWFTSWTILCRQYRFFVSRFWKFHFANLRKIKHSLNKKMECCIDDCITTYYVVTQVTKVNFFVRTFNKMCTCCNNNPWKSQSKYVCRKYNWILYCIDTQYIYCQDSLRTFSETFEHRLSYLSKD